MPLFSTHTPPATPVAHTQGLGPFDKNKMTHNKLEIMTPFIEQQAKSACNTSATLYMTGVQCSFHGTLANRSHSNEDTYMFSCKETSSGKYSSVVSHSTPGHGKCTYTFEKA